MEEGIIQLRTRLEYSDLLPEQLETPVISSKGPEQHLVMVKLSILFNYLPLSSVIETSE